MKSEGTSPKQDRTSNEVLILTALSSSYISCLVPYLLVGGRLQVQLVGGRLTSLSSDASRCSLLGTPYLLVQRRLQVQLVGGRLTSLSRDASRCSLLGDIMKSLLTSTLGWSPCLAGAYITLRMARRTELL